MIKPNAFLFVCCFFSSIFTCIGQSELKHSAVDGYIHEVMTLYGIPGAAVAVVKEGKTIHQQYYGKAKLDQNIPVGESTLFKQHSLSKIFVATGIFQLIEQGRLSLEDEIGKHLEGLPDKWQTIKIKHLLTHSSGLPEIVVHIGMGTTEEMVKPDVFKDEFQFSTGAQFGYNQTNFWLLNRIIEKVTQKKFVDFVLQNQFAWAPENSALFLSQNSQKAAIRATGYRPDSKGGIAPENFGTPRYIFGAAGLNLTLPTFIQWNQNLDNDQLLKEETKLAMWSPFKYDNGHQFAYNWSIHEIRDRLSYGFSGGTVVGFRKFVQDDLTIIWLTNGYERYYNMEEVINRIAGMVDSDLIDKMLVIRDTLFASFSKKESELALQDFQAIKQKNPTTNFEELLNRLGYEFLRSHKFETALTIFKLNVQEYPEAWNVYDSLAEGYERIGDNANAIKNYKKSVELNKNNTHGIERLKHLQWNLLLYLSILHW